MIKPISIKIYPPEGGALQVDEAVLDTKCGIVGNKHDDISFLSRDAFEFQNKNPDGMCMARFKENMVVDVNFQGLDVLEIGTATVEMTEGKRFCFDSCKYFSESELCPFKAGITFGRVVKNGIIKT